MTSQTHRPRTLITSDGDKVYLYDMERFYRRFLPEISQMDELLEAGYYIREWENLDTDEIAELADLVNLFAESADWLIPELLPPASAQELAQTLENGSYPPGQPRSRNDGTTDQRTLRLLRMSRKNQEAPLSLRGPLADALRPGHHQMPGV